MIKIAGKHYFACDYVFSNVYGESVFFDDSDEQPASPSLVFSPAENNTEENLRMTLPETPLDTLSSLPACTREINFASSGTVLPVSGDGTYIRYGSDQSPMCIHIRPDGSISVTGDEEDLAEIVFEDGKTNHIALQASLFSEEYANDPALSDIGSPFHLSVSTSEIRNRMTENGGTLTIRYSIDVNGMLAEVSDITLTADRLGKKSGRRRSPAERSARS